MWVKTQIFLDEYKNLDLLKEALCHEYCLGNPYVYFQLIMSHRHILLMNGFAFSDKKKGGFRIFVNTLMASRYPFGITSNWYAMPVLSNLVLFIDRNRVKCIFHVKSCKVVIWSYHMNNLLDCLLFKMVCKIFLIRIVRNEPSFLGQTKGDEK